MVWAFDAKRGALHRKDCDGNGSTREDERGPARIWLDSVSDDIKEKGLMSVRTLNTSMNPTVVAMCIDCNASNLWIAIDQCLPLLRPWLVSSSGVADCLSYSPILPCFLRRPHSTPLLSYLSYTHLSTVGLAALFFFSLVCPHLAFFSLFILITWPYHFSHVSVPDRFETYPTWEGHRYRIRLYVLRCRSP